MTDSRSLTVLDVGHGSCAIVRDRDWVAVVDAAPGDVLLRSLEDKGIVVVDAMILSHADADHIGGVVALLTHPGVRVRQLYVNGDWFKATRTWKSLRQAVADARRRYDLVVTPHVATDLGRSLRGTSIELEVVAPAPELVLGSSERTDLQGRAMTSNSLSAVIRVLVDGRPVALLMGDIDAVGFQNVEREAVELAADVLVFPHHGGLPGGAMDGRQFAVRICEGVRPQLVVFSIGRERHPNPRPEIVEGVRAVVGEERIACTQLSRNCASTLPSNVQGRVLNLPSRGETDRCCCAGSITIEIEGDGSRAITPSRQSHLKFIRRYVGSPMCLGAS